MDELYREAVLQHAKHPHHKGALASCDIVVQAGNPNCGDSLTLYLSLDKRTHTCTASFDGEGCAISQAAASMLMEKIHTMPFDTLLLITQDDIFRMLGVPISPARSQCALLAYNALEKAVKQYKKNTNHVTA